MFSFNSFYSRPPELYSRQRKFLDTSKQPIYPEIFQIRQIKKGSKREAGGCLHFDTKLAEIG